MTTMTQSTRHRFPSACLASQPPDDRTSTFDPLAGIETEPMNLPSGIATREESNSEDIASSEALISFLVSPRGKKVCRPRAIGGYTFFDEADLSIFIFFAPIVAFLVGVRDSRSLLILYVLYTYRTYDRILSDVERVKERDMLKRKLALFEITRIVL